jgi:hypothetical protein
MGGTAEFAAEDMAEELGFVRYLSRVDWPDAGPYARRSIAFEIRS